MFILGQLVDMLLDDVDVDDDDDEDDDDDDEFAIKLFKLLLPVAAVAVVVGGVFKCFELFVIIDVALAFGNN